MAAVSRKSLISWSASGVLHLAACVIAACISLAIPVEPELPLVESAWLPGELTIEPFADAVEMPAETLDDTGGRLQDGGEMGSAVSEESTSPSSPAEVAVVPHLTPVPLNFVFGDVAQGDLLSQLARPRAFRGDGGGYGDGVGDGGFFGLNPQVAQRIVYIVDNSKSMNYPYDGPAKTRFNRVKIELVNSIWLMEPHQQFYVIFFNNQTWPMPSKSMAQATQQSKERYLTWVATMRAQGSPTDPRQAMKLALSLQPDIIYFLTDGEFTKPANRPMLKVRQDRAVINTFAFGGETSEAVLTSIAKNNGGKFTVIP